jgi:hypothetical protein
MQSKFVAGVICGRLRFREPLISIDAKEIEQLIQELRNAHDDRP